MEHIELAEAARDARMGVWFNPRITLGWRYNRSWLAASFLCALCLLGAFLLRPFMQAGNPV
jgi:hypothetical protein